MKIMIISDLHLGNGTSYDTFGWNENKFISILDSKIKEKDIERLILAGDTYELYKYNLFEIHIQHKKLFGYLRERGAVFIKGNHDSLLIDMPSYYDIKNSKGQLIHIEHGHKADILCGNALGNWISGMVIKAIKPLMKIPALEKIYHSIISFEDEVRRIPRKYNSLPYLKYAMKLFRKYDVVILGHTHKIEVHKTYHLNNKKIYLNAGSCSIGRFQCLIFDTESFEFETIKISKEELDMEVLTL